MFNVPITSLIALTVPAIEPIWLVNPDLKPAGSAAPVKVPVQSAQAAEEVDSETAAATPTRSPVRNFPLV